MRLHGLTEKILSFTSGLTLVKSATKLSAILSNSRPCSFLRVFWGANTLYRHTIIITIKRQITEANNLGASLNFQNNIVQIVSKTNLSLTLNRLKFINHLGNHSLFHTWEKWELWTWDFLATIGLSSTWDFMFCELRNGILHWVTWNTYA